MAKNKTLFSTDMPSAAQLADTFKGSAQQIWLAGLGAFSKAQEEGGKAFEKLVREGVTAQRKTQSVASEKMSEAASTLGSVAAQINSRASGQWDKLESIFENRVAKSLARLGVPDAKDIAALHARIDALQKQAAAQPAGENTPAASTANRAPRATAKKAASKSPAKTAAKVPVSPTAEPSTKAAGKTTAKVAAKTARRTTSL